MFVVNPLFLKPIMGGLSSILTMVSAYGHQFVVAVVARFRSSRTVPKILLSNHALAELVNAIICVPFYTIYTVWEASWFRGNTYAIYDKFLWSSLRRYSP